MDKLPTFWAVKSTIQVSGELTTSRGPGTSFEFALSLVEQLFGESVAKEVAELLVRSIAVLLMSFYLSSMLSSKYKTSSIFESQVPYIYLKSLEITWQLRVQQLIALLTFLAEKTLSIICHMQATLTFSQ